MMKSRPLKRILYVEDEPDIQIVVELALQSGGDFEVATCTSGEEALLRAPGFAPDLLLLDLMMPGLNGVETLRALRQMPQTRATPAILVTASVRHDEASRSDPAVIGIIPKPFDPMTLPQTILRMWEQHHDPRLASI